VLRAIQLGGLRLLIEQKGIAMDPATAISNAIAAFFTYLATPEGQKDVEQFRTTVTDFNTKIADLFNHLHGSIVQAVPPKPTS